MDTVLDHESEGYTIPIPLIMDAIERMPYASHERVCFQLLYYTGARVQELDHMRASNLYGEWLYWACGKNQTGKWRKERLPVAFLEELQAYRATHRVYGDQLVGVTGETFRGYFKQSVRQTLGPAWQKRRVVYRKTGMATEYLYQLKGLRKNYQSLCFKRELDKWGDPGISIEMVGRRMRYSTAKISARHYVEGFDTLGIGAGRSLDPASLLKSARQRRIMDYLTPE